MSDICKKMVRKLSHEKMVKEIYEEEGGEKRG
jgi:hypothetical protein